MIHLSTGRVLDADVGIGPRQIVMRITKVNYIVTDATRNGCALENELIESDWRGWIFLFIFFGYVY